MNKKLNTNEIIPTKKIKEMYVAVSNPNWEETLIVIHSQLIGELNYMTETEVESKQDEGDLKQLKLLKQEIDEYQNTKNLEELIKFCKKNNYERAYELTFSDILYTYEDEPKYIELIPVYLIDLSTFDAEIHKLQSLKDEIVQTIKDYIERNDDFDDETLNNTMEELDNAKTLSELKSIYDNNDLEELVGLRLGTIEFIKIEGNE